jgi:CRISPR-associated protein Cas4
VSVEPSPRPPGLSIPLTPVKATLRRPVELPEYLPARMLNEFVYCPRLFFYEWVDGVFRHSSDTVDGAQKHERGDEREDELPPHDELDGVTFKARGITLSSDTHHLIAKLDVLEADNGRVTPVDYKRGAPRETESGPEAWPADLVQVCVQALVLRDNGYQCDEGLLYYYETRQRVRVRIDEGTIAQTIAALDAARALARAGRIEASALITTPRSPRCFPR